MSWVAAVVLAGCSGAGGEASPSSVGATVPPTGDATVDATSRATTPSTPPAARPAPSPAFETLPPVGSYVYDTTEGTVIAQISSRVPRGPDVPLLTLYGDGLVIAGTTGGWFSGRLADGDIQLFLDDAESVGLLDESLSLRGPDTGAEPDLTVEFDVDGMPREHEFDLSRIERPVALRAFLQDASVYNRFELTEPFDPGAWLSCNDDGCTVAETPSSAADRPVLPHEEVESLLD